MPPHERGPQPSGFASLNDAFRDSCGAPSDRAPPGRVVMTAGVAARSPAFLAAAFARVRTFETFTEDNDPYGEHDFGAFDLEGERLFWKIDYFADEAMTAASEDPADPARSYRVLTV